MERARLATLAGAFLLLATAAAAVESAKTPGPQGPEGGLDRRQAWLIPLPGERLLMHAIVLRPPGPGPFPLAVINHGSVQSSFERGRFQASDYPYVSRWFLDRGYAVVLPVRPGHGETGGPYFEDQGRCENPDYVKSGLAIADSIQATIDYVGGQPFAAKAGAVVVGQSAGGWGALALASRNPGAVRAIINFSGGRGGHADDIAGKNCAPDRLVAAAAELGTTARVPTLWLYSRNDSFFNPDLSRQMYEAFHGGSVAEYHLLPPIGPEGHLFIDNAESAPLWIPILDRFLSAHP
jgi:dienelactone hydrolase